MPQTKSYKGKKDPSNKRRPHHEIDNAIAEAEEINTEAQNEGVSMSEGDAYTHGSPAHVNIDVPQSEAEMVSEGGPAFGDEPSARNESQQEKQREKQRLEFYGSELIRQRAPKAMEIADTVADEWMNDGQFQGLPIGNPIAQIAAAKALRTAKDVEKKLEEKGVIAMARMGFDLVKSKINKR